VRGIPTLGFETRTEAVVALRGEGKSREEVARELKTTANNVKNLEAYAAKTPAVLKARRKQQQDRRRITISDPTVDTLERHALARSITFQELARRLLDAIARDGLVDNVLDDGDEIANVGH